MPKTECLVYPFKIYSFFHRGPISESPIFLVAQARNIVSVLDASLPLYPLPSIHKSCLFYSQRYPNIHNLITSHFKSCFSLHPNYCHDLFYYSSPLFALRSHRGHFPQSGTLLLLFALSEILSLSHPCNYLHSSFSYPLQGLFHYYLLSDCHI